jgi:molecular chaperone GrpE (heat shock protein)
MMAKKKAEDKTEKASKTAAGRARNPEAGSAAAAQAPVPPSKRPRRASPKPASTAPRAAIAASEPGLRAILGEIRTVKQMLEKLVTPFSSDGSRSDAALESSVDSLRRLLSELIEQRMEAVVRDLVDIRRQAAAVAQRKGTGIVERLDQVLEDLGAIRFEAEPMDVVDPLIHAVTEERQRADAPDGVILETVRPGFRTARGVVVCKAAVAVNRRA